jgi:SAM-dependent methyltransferase
MPAVEGPSFWETEEAVERFAARDPDVRLVALLDAQDDPAGFRVLDLGCAAGRNAVLLAERVFDLQALDASSALVERTRERLAPILGRENAESRVRVGRMEQLADFPDASFDLVVALGVLHQAQSGAQWKRAVAEVARLLVRGGRLLYAGWSPLSRPDGVPLEAVPGEPGMYLGFHTGRHYLVGARDLDTELAGAGFTPEVPTEEVRVALENGERVTVNGLYRSG